MKKLVVMISTFVAALANYIANKELASACTVGCYQPELPEENK